MSDVSSTKDPWAKYLKPPAQAAPQQPAAAQGDPWAKYMTPPPGTRPAGPMPTSTQTAKPGAAAPGWLETGADVAKSLGSGAVRFGTEDIPQLPGAIAKGAVWLGHKAGIKGGDETAEAIARGGRAVSDVANRLTGHAAEYEPKTTLGRYAQTVGEFLPGAVLPGGEALMAGRLGEAALAAGSGAVKNALLPGVASEAAGEATKGTALEPYARAGGALLGAGAGSAGRAVLSPRMTPEVVGAGERLGVAVPRFAAAEGTIPQRVGSGLGQVPVLGDVVPRAATAAKEQLGEAASRAAAATGKATEPGIAGANVQGALGDWVKDTSTKRVSDAYDQAATLMDPAAQAPLNETRSAVADILARRQASQMRDKVGPAVKSVIDATQARGGLTFNGLKDLRTTIGQKLEKGALLPEDWNPAEIKQIYGAMSKDLDTAAQTAGGPRGQAAWKRANDMASSYQGRREALTKILGLNETSRSGEQVFGTLQALAKTKGGDAKTLAMARRSVSPEEWNNLSASVVERMGRDANGVFSPDRFMSDYGQMSPAGKKVMFGGQGNLQASLDDIATVSDRFKQLRPFQNPSGTAQHLIGAAQVGSVAHNVWHLLAGGGAAEPLTTAATALGTHGMARLMASPASASSLARWSSAYQRFAFSPTTAAATALVAASRNLSNTANSELGTNISAEQLLGKQASADQPFRVEVPFTRRATP